MASTDFAMNRVFNYMSRMWQEHEALSEKRRELESSAEELKNQIRNLERNWILKFTNKSVRSTIHKLKACLASVSRRLSSVVQRCLAIAKATDSWAGVFVA
jgi:chromosome segregation ATPase